MNIFVLDRNPVLAAKYHCDKHVVKMILETSQMLSTARHLNGLHQTAPLKPAFENHPCTRWVAESLIHYGWAFALLDELCLNYTERYGKVHAYETTGIVEKLGGVEEPKGEVRGGIQFVQCMPEKYKGDDPVLAYRAYYRGEKVRFARWRNQEPFWWREVNPT